MNDYRRTAKRLWKPVEWVHGDGPVALVAFCKVTTVTLWPDVDHAERSRWFIDRFGCGGGCHRDHAIVDLAEVGVR
jgi:hypothetical protein